MDLAVGDPVADHAGRTQLQQRVVEFAPALQRPAAAAGLLVGGLLVGSGDGNLFAFGGRHQRLQTVVVSLEDGIELMVVATGTMGGGT